MPTQPAISPYEGASRNPVTGAPLRPIDVPARNTRGDQGDPGPSGGLLTYTAGAILGGHRAVVTNNTDGRLIYADNTDEDHAARAPRITLGAAVEGDPIEVQIIGSITESSWTWTPGQLIYVGTNGLLTQTYPIAPAVFVRVIAFAETATRIFIIREPAVLLA